MRRWGLAGVVRRAPNVSAELRRGLCVCCAVCAVSWRCVMRVYRKCTRIAMYEDAYTYGVHTDRVYSQRVGEEGERARARQRDLGVVGVLHHAEEVVVDQDLPTV
jgi:hypothetical protein